MLFFLLYFVYICYPFTLLAFCEKQGKNLIVQENMSLTVHMTLNALNL